MTKLKKSDFEQNAVSVARNLLGRSLALRSSDEILKVRLTEIAAYEGLEKRTSKGALFSPGIISISCKFGQYLFDVSTGREYEPSCITIRGIELESGERVEGPGNVTRELGIDKETRKGYNGIPIYGDQIWIAGEQPGKIQRLEGNSPNCKGFYRLE